MTSPYTAPEGIQKFGNIEYEWLPLLKTPCFGFSGPFACYSDTCNHNPKLGYQPLPHQQNYIRKYPIAKKPAYFALFQTNDRNCAPKLSTFEQPTQEKCDSACSQCSYSTSLSPISSALSNFTYDSHDHFDQTHSNNCVEDDGSRSPAKDQHAKSSECNESDELSSLSSDRIRLFVPNYMENGRNTCPDNTDLDLHGDNNEKALRLHDENVSTKKHTFNPLSKPFEPTRSTSDYFSQSESSSNDSTSPPSPASPISLDSSDEPLPSGDNGNLKHVFQQFFDKHSLRAPVKKDQQKKFNCILCSAEFYTFEQLQKHISDKIQKPYECIICGETFSHLAAMRRHRSSHRNMRMFSCRGCYKKFRSFPQLNNHFDSCRFKLYIYA